MNETRPVPDTSDVPSEEELSLIDAYWRAANYLSVGQIYLASWVSTSTRTRTRMPRPTATSQLKARLSGFWWYEHAKS